MKILTITANGARIQTTEMSGNLVVFPEIGLPIATDTGPMFLPGDGHGSKMSPGVSRPSTMDDGLSYKAAGAGFRDRLPYVRSTPLRWLLLSVAEDLPSESASDPHPWDGFRLGREKFTFPGIAPARVTYRT
jgi:hypothetical protein